MMDNEKKEFVYDKIYGYDLRYVSKWDAPKEDGVPILTMPNVPKPVHKLCPRTILGNATWDHMRKRCYFEAGYKSQVSGFELDRSSKERTAHAHELASYDYATGEARFERTVCLSPLEHNFIHSGRMLTLYKQGSPLATKRYVLKCLENGFKLVNDWNEMHKNMRPLRVYYTLAEYAVTPGIADEVKALIKKYNIKFYAENPHTLAPWDKWGLWIGNKFHKTPYKNEDEWKEKVENVYKYNRTTKAESDIMVELQRLIDAHKKKMQQTDRSSHGY